jgi:hypothetical protein
MPFLAFHPVGFFRLAGCLTASMYWELVAAWRRHQRYSCNRATGFFLREQTMIVTILVILLILMFLGGGYGYRSGNNMLAGGGGLVGLILLVLVVLFLLGHISV